MLDGRWLYVAAVPIALAILARRTSRGRTIVALVALAHLAVLGNVTLFPIPIDQAAMTATRTGGDLQLVPFATIGLVLAGHAGATAERIALLNVFVLTPAAICAALLYPTLRRRPAVLALALGGGCSIEAAQLAISTVIAVRYRTVDVDDAILNAIGIVVGVLAVVVAARATGARQSAVKRELSRR